MNIFSLLVLFVLLQNAFAQKSNATVYYNSSTNEYKLTKGVIDQSGVAWGTFADELQTTGWSKLYVHTNWLYSDEIQMFAAGYVEGALTADLIYNSHLNVPAHLFGSNTVPTEIATFLSTQYKWLQNMIASKDNYPNTSSETVSSKDYWTHAGYIVNQLEGMLAGYNSVAQSDHQLALMDMLILNSAGDLFDIIPAVMPNSRIHFHNTSRDKLLDLLMARDHCTAMIRVTDDLEELFFSHSTWFSYTWMLRVFKYYDFPLNHPATQSKVVGFSSYPGAISSIDDFYTTDSGLAVTETTNSVLDNSLYNLVNPQTVLAWMRVVMANRLTTNGQPWTELFARHNSGTYNNQWMVVDYKLFTPGQTLPANTFWILEQIPGYTEAADMTATLDLGYWPSYNVPFFPEIYNRSGYIPMFQKYGDAFSYGHCPRANILRRDHSSVHDVKSMQKLMLANNWQTDPFSLNDPCNQVVARCDLRTSNTSGGDPSAMGGIDSKILSASLYHQGQLGMHINSGPSHEVQTPFSWNSAWKSLPHVGQPTTFDFDWQFIQYHP